MPTGIRVPSPKRKKVWDGFWPRYKAERALLEAYPRGELTEDVTLDIFRIRLTARGSAKLGRISGTTVRQGPMKKSSTRINGPTNKNLAACNVLSIYVVLSSFHSNAADG